MKKLLVILLVLVLCVSIVGCTTEQAEAVEETASEEATAAEETMSEDVQVIKIGALLPMSGAVASQGELMKMGLEAAVEYFNENVGFESLENVEIELIIADSESTPDVGLAEFEKLVTVENVSVVLGSYQSAVTSPCATLANKYGVPYVIINAISDSILSEDANYVFRPCVGSYSQQAAQQYFLELLDGISPVESIGFVGSADDYGDSVLASFTTIAENIGAEITVSDQVQSGVADMSGIVQRLKAAEVDVAIVSLQLNEALLFQRQLKEYNVNIPVVAQGGGYMDSTFIDSAGDTAEQVVSSAAWIYDVLNSLDEDAQEWATVIESKSTTGLKMTETCCNAWLAMGITLDAIERAGSYESQAIADALDVTDMGTDHWANMFNQHPYIRFEDTELPDGTMMYNQNFGAGLQFGQIIDGEWKLVAPFEIVGEYGSDTNPMVWPTEEWADR
jgi:branched-chain amino acid transport system substrate-binding protein